LIGLVELPILSSAPYVTDKNEWVLQVTGDKADELVQNLKTGDKVQISADTENNNL